MADNKVNHKYERT